MSGWTLTIVRGEQYRARGTDLNCIDSPLWYVTNLPREMDSWLEEHGVGFDAGVWCLVTPDDQEPAATDTIDSRHLEVVADVDRGYPETPQIVYRYVLEPTGEQS